MSQMRPFLWLTRTPAAGKAQPLFLGMHPVGTTPSGPMASEKLTSADVLEPLAAMHVQMVAETRIDSGRTMWQMIEITICTIIYVYIHMHINAIMIIIMIMIMMLMMSLVMLLMFMFF